MSCGPWVMTESAKQKVRENYATVADVRDLAKEIRASVSCVRHFASLEGIRRSRCAYKKITPLVAKQIAEEYAREPSSRRLSEMFGLSHQGILNVVRKEGGKVRSREDHGDSAVILAEVCAA